jgi:ABC-type arginine/histidine transport system permease subunit
MNLSLEQIAQATSLPLEKIQDLQNQMRNWKCYFYVLLLYFFFENPLILQIWV